MYHLISVVVPVYNSELVLMRCLESLALQTSLPKGWGYEVIIVDDGSTDGSSHIYESFCSKYSFFISFYQKNQGLADARNRGIKEAHGDFLFFIDSDDALTPVALSLFARTQEKYASDIVVGKFRPVSDRLIPKVQCDGQNMLASVVESSQAIANTHDEKDGVTWVVSWNKLYRSSLFQNVRFPAGFRRFEDEATTPFLYDAATSIVCISATTYLYFYNSDGLSHNRGPSFLPNAFFGSKKLLTLFIQKDYFASIPYRMWQCYVFFSGCYRRKALTVSEIRLEKRYLRNEITIGRMKGLPFAKKVFLVVFRLFGISLYAVFRMDRHLV